MGVLTRREETQKDTQVESHVTTVAEIRVIQHQANTRDHGHHQWLERGNRAFHSEP